MFLYGFFYLHINIGKAAKLWDFLGNRFLLGYTGKVEGSQQWKDAVQRVRRFKGVVMAIGGTDTGKSTLVRQLLAQALTPKRVIAVVDADMGQSSFGPPTCMSLTLWKKPR